MAEESFGPYRLHDLLGEGGMGRVYRAYDTTTDRFVALKVLPPHAAKDPAFQTRFRREAHIAAGLNDPHVVPIHRFGEIEGQLFVDMRLIEGQDLSEVLALHPLDAPRAVGVVEQVAEALDTAHAAGLVHRDIKPSNILLARRDFVYLIDFGLAQAVGQTRLTATGAAVGTFAYMAPERFESVDAEPLSDVYALACVLYECLTGRVPFPGHSLQEQIAAHLTKPPPKPSATGGETVPQALDAVVAKGMAKNPDERHRSALELAHAARAALDGPGTPRRPPTQDDDRTRVPDSPIWPWSEPPPARSPVRRIGGRRWPVTLAGILMVIAAVAVLPAALVTPQSYVEYVSEFGRPGFWPLEWISYQLSGLGIEEWLPVVVLDLVCFTAAFVLAGYGLFLRRGHPAPAIVSFLVASAFIVLALVITVVGDDVQQGAQASIYLAATVVFALLTVLGAVAAVATGRRFHLLAVAAGLLGAAGTVNGWLGRLTYEYDVVIAGVLSWLWVALIAGYGVWVGLSAGRLDAPAAR